MYDEVTVYYSTGTGNSYRVATWLAEVARARAATSRISSVRVSSIEDARPDSELRASASSLLGLVMPTHAFTAPWAMVRFVLSLPRRPGTHAFVMATRAGLELGPVVIPGLEGTACYLVALILALKGYRVRGALGVDMPSNWQTVHPGLSPESVEAIAARSRPRVARFADDVLAGRRRLGGVGPLLLGIVLAPVSVLFLAWGRFFMAKLLFASERCTGCGLCARSCPRGAIRMLGGRRGGKPRPYWGFTCESCMRCMGYCPERAVEAGYSWAYVLLNLTSVPVGTYLLRRLGQTVPALSRLDRKWMALPLQLGYRLLAVYLAYHAFTALLRVPIVNRFFTLTTPTHYYRRYHEPRTPLAEISRHAGPR